MLIIVERIKSSRESIENAILSRGTKFIQGEAKVQAGSRADYMVAKWGALSERRKPPQVAQ